MTTLYAVLVLLVAAVFFAAIPGAGAFLARGRWRGFRARMTAASLLPLARYSDVTASGPQNRGPYRFFGRLEAIQGEDRIWLSDGRFSVAADLRDISVYLLPSFAAGYEDVARRGLEELVPDEEPRRVRWKRIFSLPEGMEVFVAGHLFAERGGGVFRSHERDRLLVVIFDGAPNTLLRRAIWGGRQRNEYWNQFTLASLLTGSVALLIGSFVLLADPFQRVPALLALTASTFPIASVLPPGVLLYFPYRRLWRRGRLLRAARDLLRLPLRYFPDGSAAGTAQLPTGETYGVGLGEEKRVKGAPPIRIPSFARTEDDEEALDHTFGAVRHDELGEYLCQPDDPMAELVRIRGDPRALSELCSVKARLLEIVSGMLVLTDLALNLFIVLFVLALLL